jgi:hypothetical protein
MKSEGKLLQHAKDVQSDGQQGQQDDQQKPLA